MSITEYVGSSEQITIPEALWAIIFGMAKSRKTSTALSWPEPLFIAELDCSEERLKYCLDMHAAGKKATFDVITPSNQNMLTESEAEDMMGRTEKMIRIANSAGEGTLILDGGNTLYRLYQLVFVGHDFSAGKPEDLKGAASAGARADFARISQHFEQLLMPMRAHPNLNVVFTTEPKEVWVDGKGSGKFEPRGPDSWDFKFDVEMMTYVVGGEYDDSLGRAAPIEGYGVIKWCSYNDARMRGKIIKEPTFDKIRAMLA